MRVPTWLSVGLVLGAPLVAAAQGIPVYDNTNFLQNLITAVQSTITAVATAETAASMVLELTPLDEIIAAEGIAADAVQLTVILQEAEALYGDIQSVQFQLHALFNLDTVPTSTSELQVRLGEIRRMRYAAYSYAIRVQTLLRTLIHTLDHATRLVQSIQGLLGGKQSAQVLLQLSASANQTLTLQTAQTGAYQQAGSLDRMEELLTIEALHRINAETMADWPRRSR